MKSWKKRAYKTTRYGSVVIGFVTVMLAAAVFAQEPDVEKKKENDDRRTIVEHH